MRPILAMKVWAALFAVFFVAWFVAVGTHPIVSTWCAALVGAQSRPDFSGTWTGSGNSITIRQNGVALTVGEGAQARVYNLDGAESRFVVGMSQMAARARWAGSALVVEVTHVTPSGTWVDVEVYSMDYGPKLSVVRVRTQTTHPMMYTTVDTYSKASLAGG